MISRLDIRTHSWRDSCTDRALYFALATIGASGLALSACSIISYVPPLAGCFGGVISLSTLTTLAIHYIVKRRSESAPPPRATDEEFVIPSEEPPPVLGVTSTESQEVVIQRPEIESSALIDMFPDTLFLEIFKHLEDPCDLATASMVSRKWYHIASDKSLWKNLCTQKMVLPCGLTMSENAKALFQQTGVLKRNVQRVPHERRIAIPCVYTKLYSGSELDKPEFSQLLKANNLFFFYDNKGSFQVWDTSFRSYVIGQKFESSLFRNMHIKRFGQIVYFIGDNRYQLHLTEAYVYPFDLDTNRFLPMLEFPYSQFVEDCRSIFEFGDQKAIFGCLNGQIIVWDLRYKGWEAHQRNHSDEYMINYIEDLWTEADEKEWEASFLKKDLVERHYLRLGKITKEEGAFWREGNKGRRAYRHAIQNRIFLDGHTSRITALKSVDHFLFSCSKDGILKQWDLTTRSCIQTIEIGVKDGFSLLEVADRYVFGKKDNFIYQWNYETGELVNQIEFTYACQTFQIHGNLIFSFNGWRPAMEVYDLSIKKCIKVIEGENIHSLSNFVIENNCVYLLGRDAKDRSSELVIWDFSPYL